VKTTILSLVLVLASVAVAEAYPQFQLSRDQTCTGCHLSPAGGGLLNENGYTVAEGISQFGHKPEFMYGKLLKEGGSFILGGDVRAAGGYLKYGGSEDSAVYAFPMQADLYGRIKLGGGVSLQASLGIRPAEETNEALTTVWSREHYLTWQSKEDENYGLYVRAGRFLPVFGLRFAEHPMYTRRYGGTQLYTDTYAVSVSNVTEKSELHVTAFMEDLLIDPVEHANGAAAYGELRISPTLQVGGGVMFKSFTNGKFFLSDELDYDSKEFRIAATNKLYLEGLDLLLSTEIQFINQLVGKSSRSDDSAIGGAPKGVVGNIVASKMLGSFLLLDVGIGHFDSNFRIKNLDRDCIDINFHWFTTSHLELVLNTRYELLGFGSGGEPGAYALLQVHYRL
jgi:hypothetical protein